MSLQREESRLAELRAELVSVLANMDVDASELKELEQQEIDQLRLLAAKRCPTQLAAKQKAVHFKPRSRRNVAGEQGNLLHLCVVSWNVAGIPLDDLDVWLQRVSDHFPWDLICLQEGFKRLNGVEIRGGHGVFTPCRQLGGLRSPAIIVRSGSACDDVVFLASDTRWLAVKSESMKMIFVSLHLPHRRISLVACTSIFTVLREALLGVSWCLQVCVWYGHKHSSLGLQRWSSDWKLGSSSVGWSVPKGCRQTRVSDRISARVRFARRQHVDRGCNTHSPCLELGEKSPC